MKVSSLKRPTVDPEARKLGTPAREQLLNTTVPLVIGGVVAAAVPMRGPDRVVVALIALLFSAAMFVTSQLRLYLTPDRLVIRSLLFWQEVRLDQLVRVEALPSTRTGSHIRLRDAVGGECIVSFSPLSPAGLRRLISTLRAQLDRQPGVELVGGVERSLTRYETGKWRKLD